MLVLSTFPGIGMFDRAFELEGFCVVRGPDSLWGGDIKSFHPPAGKFDGVIGGTPCQQFSRLAHLVAYNHRKDPTKYHPAPNLIPEFERVVSEAQPAWFLMENVPQAPLPSVSGYIVKDAMVRDVWVGGMTTRLRRFSFGTRNGLSLSVEVLALHVTSEPYPAVLASGGSWVPVKIGGSGKPKRIKVRVGRLFGDKTDSYFRKSVVAQGLPPEFDLPPFKVAEKIRAIGNGVPLPMGRAVAKAVKQALSTMMVGIILLIGQPTQAASQRGYASWYSYASARREGNSGIMANGRRMDDQAYTAASWDYAFGTHLRVTTTTGTPRTTMVTITDRGPNTRLVRQGRILDLSPAAFQALAPVSQGIVQVEISEAER